MKISVNYQEVSPESCEHGDFHATGHYDDYEGTPSEILDMIGRRHGTGSFEASNSGPAQDCTWYTTTEPDRDYKTGHETNYTFHIDSGDDIERAQFHKLMRGE